MLQKNWSIQRVWKNEAGGLEAVEFAIDFAESSFPGEISRHLGVIPLHGIPADAGRQELVEGIIAWYGPQFEMIEAHHSEQLAFKRIMAQNEAVAVDPQNFRADDVDRERDRRISAGFAFEGVRYQTRPEDRENMAGASTAAIGAMMSGAQPGDLRWHGGATDFEWIAEDNTLHPMDAQTMFNFGRAAMSHKQAHIFAARTIKDMSAIPPDFASNEGYWQ